MELTRGRARLREIALVGGGLGLIALSAYAVLAMAGHALAPPDYAAVGSLYLLVSIVGPGIFVAVEQQTAREVAARITSSGGDSDSGGSSGSGIGGVDSGGGWAPVLRSAAVVSARLAGLVTLGVAALSPILVPRVFGGSWLLLFAAVLAVWGAAASYPLRGVYAGQRRFDWYGGCMAIEGVARTAACAGLVGLGVTGGGWYGLVFGFGLVISAGLTLAGPRTGGAGPALPVARMSARVGLLAGGCGLTLVVANLGPVVLTARLGQQDPENAALAASFVSLFVLARIPVLLVTPVQALLLPRLTAAAERGAFDVLRGLVRNALLAVAAVGVPGVVVGTLWGPSAAQAIFGAPLRLSWLVAGLLGVGTVGMVAAQVLQPALVALGRNRAAMTAWGIGAGVFAVLLALPGIPLAACVAAQVTAPAVVTALMLRVLKRSCQTHTAVTHTAVTHTDQTYTATTSSASHDAAST
ncbi:MAG: lipopolysaccharide biosynthesis protein [Pseudonocardia sp.]